MRIAYRRLLPRRLRRWLRSLMVECGTRRCRRFHLSHPLLRRVPGIFLDRTWYCSPECLRDAVKQRVETQLGAAITDLRLPPRMPFRLILLSSGKVTQEQLAQARSALAGSAGMGKEREDLGDALVRLGYVTEEVIAAARAGEAGCLFFSNPVQPVAPDFVLPVSLMRSYRAAAVHHAPLMNRLLIGFVYRVDHTLLQAVEQVTGCRVESCIVTPTAWKQMLDGRTSSVFAEVQKRAVQQSRIVSLIVEEAIESRADTVRMGLSGTALWARLTGGTRSCDLVIELASDGAASFEKIDALQTGDPAAAIRA